MSTCLGFSLAAYSMMRRERDINIPGAEFYSSCCHVPTPPFTITFICALCMFPKFHYLMLFFFFFNVCPFWLRIKLTLIHRLQYRLMKRQQTHLQQNKVYRESSTSLQRFQINSSNLKAEHRSLKTWCEALVAANLICIYAIEVQAKRRRWFVPTRLQIARIIRS